MAIDLMLLFKRLGRVGYLARLVNQYQSGLPLGLESLYQQFDGLTPPTGQRDIISTAISLRQSIVENASSFLPTMQQAASDCVLRTVSEDNPSQAGSLTVAIPEVIRQMTAAAQMVQVCTVTANTTPFGNQAGNGVILVTTKRGDGKQQENLVPESATITCTGDSFNADTAAGEESFEYVGAATSDSVWNYDWPAGSGADSIYTAIDPTSGILRNSDFDTYTNDPNTPDNWTTEVGDPGNNIFSESVTVYTGNSLRFAGNATAANISQPFGVSSNGTNIIPVPLVNYGVNLWVRTSATPAAGVLTVDLADGTGTIVNDAAGTPNSFTVALHTMANSTWVPQSGVFRLPKAVPAGLKIRVRLSTALSTGTNLYIDRMSMVAMSPTYNGGPAIAVFSGNAPFAIGDGWTVQTTNNYGGATFHSTFQALFDRLFDMRSLGLVLPSSASPTLLDSLIDTAPEADMTVNVNVDVAAGGTTNTTIVAAPGAGFYLKIYGYELSSIGGGTGSVVKIQDGNGTPTIFDTIGATAVAGGGVVQPTGSVDAAMNCLENQPLVLARETTSGVRIVGHVTVETRPIPVGA